MEPGPGITIFLMLGVAQGLFLAVLLLTRRENTEANRLLAAVMAAFAVYLGEVALYAGDHFREMPHLIGVSQPVIYLFGPVIYLYARTVSSGPERPGRWSILHFVPAALVVVYFLPFFLDPAAAKIAYVEGVMRDGPPRDLRVIEWLKVVHGTIYTLATFRVLGRYRKRLEENFSTHDEINLGWLRRLLFGVMAAWLAALAQFSLELVGVGPGNADVSPVSLVLVVVVYLIGILGLRQPEVFWPPPAAGGPPEGKPDRQADESGEKYRKSGLDTQAATALEDDLLETMEKEKPHLDSGLTLQQLADRLGWSSHNLSEVINGRLGATFHDFVNGYRVEEAKRKLLDPNRAHQTVLAVALDSGFRSKSTFNKIFKRFTGLTPSVFRRENDPA